MTSVKIEYRKGYLAFRCPGCGNYHTINVDHIDKPKWNWNGDVTNPTITPSIRSVINYTDKTRRDSVCHLFVKQGQLQFLTDCTHDKAGQTLLMETIEND